MFETQSYTEYEISDDVSGKVFYSRSLDEAKAYFDKNWSIVERHITVCRPSLKVSTCSAISVVWNDNTELEEN